MNVRYAVVVNDRVINAIVGNAADQNKLAAALGQELYYDELLPLQIGDLRSGGKWLRNNNGVLQELTPAPSYAELAATLDQLYALFCPPEVTETDAEVDANE